MCAVMGFGERKLDIYLPFGDHRTTLTACVCLESVARYSTFRSSPFVSTCHSYFLISA